jgi:N-acetylglutamate synthase
MPRVPAFDLPGSDLVGRRVVVRRVADRSGPRPRYADVVGVLVAADPSGLVVRRAGGAAVRVPTADVHRVKPVPASTADILALEEIAGEGWPAPDAAWLGRWLLRAAEGFTGRANSVLPLGEPDRPLGPALAEVESWYAARSLPARFQVPLPARAALDAALAGRGWSAYNSVLVLTADVATARAATPERGDLPPVVIEPTPAADWLAGYHYRGSGVLPPVAQRILTAPERCGFAVVRSSEGTLAVGRAVVTGRWAGVTALDVAEQHRRRGLGSHVMRGLLDWAGAAGASSVYLQVAEENGAALALYARLRFAPHHRYHYRLAAGH